MSWGAVGVARYADQMGTYCENIQAWLDESKKSLAEHGLLDRFYEILNVQDFVTGEDFILGASVSYPTDDVDRQLAVLLLAISNGARLFFNDGKFANGWIRSFANSCDDLFQSDSLEYLTPDEATGVMFTV